MNGTFSPESLESAWDLLYAENPYLGKCGQKKLREQNKKPRTPAQQAADQKRAQNRARQNQSGGGNRSEAAKKAAETRKRCKGASGPTSPTSTTV